MNLLLDIGNTSIQWAMGKPGEAHVGAVNHVRHKKQWPTVCQQVVASLGGQAVKVKGIYIASVLSEEENQQIKQLLAQRTPLPVHFYYAEKHRLGFENSYAQPEKLGVDRWLAILEAWHRHGASVVIDCGSAITVDVADEQGRHLGGYIVPGLAMLVNALYQGTSQVQVGMAWPEDLALASNTLEAVNKGCGKMCASFINQLINEQNKRLGKAVVYLTGGDAAYLAPWITAPTKMDNSLVLCGLNRVAANLGERAKR